MYIAYILYSAKLKRYYSGQTCDLIRRLQEHNRGKTTLMASGVPWDLVFSHEFCTRKQAMELEKKIKSRGAERFLQDLDVG